MVTYELRSDGHYLNGVLLSEKNGYDVLQAHVDLQWAKVLRKEIDYVAETMLVIFDETQQQDHPNFASPHDWV
jgi:hypothetical protein